jgi:MFS family permease
VKARRIVVFAALIGGLLAAGYGVMFTLLDDYRDQYGISETQLGFIVGIGFIVSFVGQVTLAPLADRGHAKRLIAVGVSLQVAGLLFMGFGTAMWPIAIGRAVMGLGIGMALPAVRRVVILADPDGLGKNMGTLLSADVAGFALGPVVSAILEPLFGIAAPFVFIAAASLIAVPFVLREDVKEEVSPPTQRLAFDLLKNRGIAGAILMGLAVFVMIGTFDALWAVVLDDMKAPEWIANVGITLFAIPLLVLGRAGGSLTQRLGPFRVSTVGLTIGALMMMGYGVWPSGIVMLAFGILHGVNDGLTITGTGVAVGMLAPPERQAAAQGLFGGVQVLFGGLVAMGAGSLYEHTNRATVYTACGVLMLVLVGFGALLAGPNWSMRPTPDTSLPMTDAEITTTAAVATGSAP